VCRPPPYRRPSASVAWALADILAAEQARQRHPAGKAKTTA
jgi:hypothetical protein